MAIKDTSQTYDELNTLMLNAVKSESDAMAAAKKDLFDLKQYQKYFILNDDGTLKEEGDPSEQ